MRLSEALSEDLIFCNLGVRSKRTLLTQMVRRLVKSGLAATEEELIDAVLRRERLQSTGIGRGIAVPHGIAKSVGSLACALGISPGGVEYGAIDRQPVHLVFLFVNNKTRDIHYLSLLAAVCRLFESGKLRKKVMSSRNPREVLDLIQEEEKRECQFLGSLPA